MTKTLSADEARQQWDSIIGADSGGDEVIVEVHGETKAVVISADTYQELQNLRDKQRRAEALEQLRAIEEEQLERNTDLTQEEADELANRFAHEFFEELAAEGKLRFERDQR